MIVVSPILEAPYRTSPCCPGPARTDCTNCPADSVEQPSTSQPASHAQTRHSSALHDRAFGRQLPASQQPASKPLQGAANVHIGPVSAAETRSQQQHQQQDWQPKFVKAKHFAGGKAGYVFKKGPKGVGYYLDSSSSDDVSLSAQQPAQSSRQAPVATPVQRNEPEAADVAGALGTDAEDMQPISGKHAARPLSYTS